MRKIGFGVTMAGVLFGVACLAGAALPAAVTAQSVTANVAVVSDYRFRGISQSFRRPALQGGADYAHASGFYSI